ncbi:MAG: hypothetical protein HOH16_06150 [Planctomycetaceae bacterium]|jgi:hypothetical protein|nr:hypothetical protein [Planctomycetaceae bacterium]
MKPLILLILTGILTLQIASTWLAAFMPWVFFIACFACLAAMSFASNYQHCEACQAEGTISPDGESGPTKTKTTTRQL